MTTYIATGMSAATKKAFKEAVKAGHNVSLFGDNPPIVTLRDLHDRVGYSFTVTNARRQWFAQVTVLSNRKLKVT